MSKYTVVITQSVQKYLKKIPHKLADKLESEMMNLEINPRPFGYIKLKGKNAYRIRVGNYRIIYEIEDRILKITTIDAGDRKEIY
ncbi:MAG TPA: type II toxin-antitoxin system RelE/ParE family toxin [Hanamia sp.]|nr:type II toxin-antitoxin system RelE/ParE family toxin [Hanamia sp.]